MAHGGFVVSGREGMWALEKLTSVANPKIKLLRALKDRKAREQAGQLLVEGVKLIQEALDAGLLAGPVLVEEGREQALGALLARLAGAGVEAHAVPSHVMQAVCDTRSPQGVCAAVCFPAPLELDTPPERLVALDGVQDPGNVGTIWRTADAAGFGGLLLSAACADPFSPKVQRATMGSLFRVPVARQLELAQALAALRARDYRVVVSALDGSDFYARTPVGSRLVLVIGSEAHGVSAPVNSQATERLKLPMRGGAESLNAAVAAGIMMYELTREWA